MVLSKSFCLILFSAFLYRGNVDWLNKCEIDLILQTDEC